MQRMRTIALLVVALLTLALAALPVGCGNNAQPDGSKLVTYVIGDATGDWGYPSPYLHYSRGPGYVRMSLVFDTLVWKDDQGFTPALAEEWEYIEAENAYVFHLRSNAKWHDGEEFTAEDVAFTIDYVKMHPNPFVTLIGPTGVEHATVADQYTIKLYLEQDYAPFLNDVAATLAILPKHIWETVEKPEEFTGAQAVIGSGPFKLVDYSKAQGSYLYEAYDEYYLGRPAVDRLKFVKISEEMIPAALKQGTIDAGQVVPEMVEGVQAAGLTAIEGTYNWNAKMTMNHKKEPLSDKRFRQALAYAIDRESLVEVTQRGFAMAGSPGIIPPDSPWFNPSIEMYEYNPTRAQQLLTELGYELDGGLWKKNGTALSLSLIAASDFKDVGQFIKAALEEIGITVVFQTLEGKTVDAKVTEWDFDLSIYGHGGLYEPSILNKIITGKGFNSARYTENATLNDLLASQLAEMDPTKRKALVGQVQEVYAEDLPALTLYYPDFYWAHDGTVPLFYTEGGIASGVPIPLNKLCFMTYETK